MASVYGKIFNKKPLSPSHKKIIEMVGFSKQVLELGSSSGYLTGEFKKNDCIVDIVEQDKDDIQRAKRYAKDFYLGSLEDNHLLNKIKDKYEVVVAADVIEHLKDPERLLVFIKKWLKKDGKLILSLPNIASWQVRKKLFLKGDFKYTEEGILDKTHLKFFTFDTIQELLKEAGFKIIKIYKMETDYPFKRTVLSLGLFGNLINKTVGNLLIKRFPNLCTGHIIIEAEVNG